MSGQHLVGLSAICLLANTLGALRAERHGRTARPQILWRHSGKFKALLLLLSTLMALCLCEIFFCLLLSSKEVEQLRIFKYDPAGTISGIGLKTNFDQKWRGREFLVDVHLNNIGMREQEDYHGEAIDIGFYGDSFTFGWGVDEGQRYSDCLRAYFPDKTIRSFSWLNGWTTPHYYLFLKRHPQMMPDIGIIGLFLGNDLTNDIQDNQLLFDAEGELTEIRSLVRRVDKRGFLVNNRLDWWGRLAGQSWTGEMLLRVLHDRFQIRGSSEPGASPYPRIELDRGQLHETNMTALRYIAAMDQHFRAHNRRLIVFIIPWAFYVGDYDCYHPDDLAAEIREAQALPKRIVRWCQDNGIEVINPVAEFQRLEQQGVRLYYEKDSHWNPRGHQEAARLIAEYLRAEQRAG